MLLGILIATSLLVQTQSSAGTDWRTLLEDGKQAYLKHDYAGSVVQLKAAAEAAAAAAEGDAGVLETLRLLSAVYRDTGDLAQAELVLLQAVERCAPDSLALAATLEQLAAIQRAQGHSDETLATIERAIAIRERITASPRVELARDLTTSALLVYKTDVKKATGQLQRAIHEWDAASPGDPQVLPAIEALAAVYRDGAQYAEAEPLLFRALRMREAATGPGSAEVIAAVDSLAYVEFGLKKFTDAEPLYRRLLALWETHGGPDHPMTALTLDKMAEFFAAQQRYDEAEKAAATALESRLKMHLGSLNQAGRMLLMQAKLTEAEEHYRTAVQIGDLSKAPDEVMDPLLRIYAKILVALKRDGDAEPVEIRIKNALYRKGEREGRRPSPVQPSH